MGLPLVVVRSADDMSEVADRYQEADLILVDTPGRSQRNGEGIAEAQAFVNSVPAARREVHLAVSISTRLHGLEDVVGAFAPVGVDALVATKLDEALHFGPLVSLISRCGRPLSYVTTGQSVPEDMEAASPQSLAELVLRGARE